MDDPGRLPSLVAFAAVGALSVAQELAGRMLEDVAGADAARVAEESLALVAAVTARAAAAGFGDRPDLARAASAVLLELPFTWRDYHVAGLMLQQGDPPPEAAASYERLERATAFYSAHIVDYPGERLLTEKMALWVGRISPPGQGEKPDARLARLDLVASVARHARLVREFAAQGSG